MPQLDKALRPFRRLARRPAYERLARQGSRLVSISFPERIGHLCLEIDCLLKDCILSGDEPKRFVLFDLKSRFANQHVVSYYRKFLTLSDDPRPLAYAREFGDPAGLLLETAPYAVAMYDTAKAYDVFSRWDQRPPLFELTAEDRGALAGYLQRNGMPEGGWYVCLHVREGGYSPHDEPIHKFRTVDIRAFEPAVEEIVRRGGWVVRMGDASMRPFKPLPNTIDYARDPTKTPQLDIALTGGCRFFFGTASGLFNVAEIFGRPCVVTNMAPLAGAYAVAPDGLSIPQALRDSSGRFLGLREIMGNECRNYRLAEEFAAAGLVNVPNSPEQIAEVVVEMLERLDGAAVYIREEKRRQEAFRALFRPGDYSYGASSSIGRDFLREHFRDCGGAPGLV